MLRMFYWNISLRATNSQTFQDIPTIRTPSITCADRLVDAKKGTGCNQISEMWPPTKATTTDTKYFKMLQVLLKGVQSNLFPGLGADLDN